MCTNLSIILKKYIIIMTVAFLRFPPTIKIMTSYSFAIVARLQVRGSFDGATIIIIIILDPK